MNPWITCANAFHSEYSVPTITSFRDSRTCLGGGGGGDPKTFEASVTASTQGAGKEGKRGKAVVVVTDNLGAPVIGATVKGDFSGGINQEGVSGTTNTSGTVTLQTSGTAKGKFLVKFCVMELTAPGLSWNQTQ